MSVTRFFTIAFLITALLIVPAAAWSPPTDRSVVGVEWNASDPSPALRWIDVDGNTITPPDFNDHVVWGNIRKVLLDDNEVVTRAITPRGDTLDLTGASGKVMTEIPKFYVMSANASTGQFRYYRWFISPDPTPGFELHPAFVQRGGTVRDYIYLGSYEATLRVLDDGTLALDSRSGEQPWTGYGGSQPLDGLFAIGFAGGSSQPVVGATIAGGTSGTSGELVDLYVSSGSWSNGNAAGTLYLKQTSGTFTNGEDLKVSGFTVATAATATANAGVVANINTFETAGEALGDGYGAMNIWSFSAVRMLHLIEYANWGSQETVGLGIVSKAGGTGFAGEVTGFNSVDTNVDEYGTGTGTGTAGGTPASYRTATDLWGNSWEWVTGYTSVNAEYRITKQDGTGSLSTHPLAAGSYESSVATPLGSDGYVYGYWTSLFYEDLLQYHFIANSVTGGSQNTYGTDYQYSHNPGTRVLLAGGTWNDGRIAGLGSLGAYYTASPSHRYGGARLEFVGPTTMAGGAPGAQYALNATSGNAPLAVAFSDASTGTPGWWRWDFGDGTASTDQNPTHVYTTPGTYTVNLTSYTLYGEDTVTKAIEVLDPPVANMTYNVTEGNAPLVVQFSDASTGNVTGWSWVFGDGQTSVSQNPIHTFSTPGTYTVTLTANNAHSNSNTTTTITVLDPPKAGFSANVTEGNAPLTVRFSDASAGNVTAWSWSFGDGTTSVLQGPSHTYTVPGTYTVTLNASNTYGHDLETKSGYVTVYTPPAASFAANITEGNAPLTVQFTDISTGDVTAWSWTFGDGGTSADRNATHTYTAPGTYTVTLNASNAYGYNIETKTNYITALPPPLADFTVNATIIPVGGTAQFTDNSTGNITAWSWNFGDGNTSALQNPAHTYTSPGTYTVTLNASNAYGSDVATRIDLIDVGLPPTTSFTANITDGTAPLTVQFTDTSGNTPTSWLWDFGDDGTSTDQNASHIYTTPGTYTVILTTTNAYGEDTETQTNLITVLSPAAADFTANITSGNAPLTVQFTDTSTGTVTAWNWNFGDGNTSTLQSPSHTYTGPGLYTVTLNASNPYGYNIKTRTGYVTVLPPPVAAFAVDLTVIPVGGTVQFTDASTGNVTAWNWNFGDGTYSTSRNPSHIYTTPGTYTVTLTASNAYGSDVATKIDLIDVGLPPTTSFTANITDGTAPLTVQFTDTSGNTPTSWHWDFGDDGTSTDQNATHIYTAPGLYTVTLTTTNAYGEGTETQTNLITVLSPAAADFTANITAGNAPLAVQFTDTSTGTVTAWNWNFGDGNASTLQSPSHTYTGPGLYTVALNASNPYGYNIKTQTGYITVISPPAANFSVDHTVIPVGGTVQFTDNSTGNITAWSWNFGDGTTSALQSPSHTYTGPGLYTVTLNASNAYGYNIETKTNLVDVGYPPTASFTPSATVGVAPGEIAFTDTSGNTPTSWFWTFGDGNTSALQNPVNTYTVPGTYTVTLTASNAYGNDTETEIGLITIYDPVTASFTVNSSAGLTPHTVQFTDTSTGTPTVWSWAFGDGATSTDQNPVHTYTSAGTYTVTLTAANGGDNDTLTRTDYIKVFDPVTASFTVNTTLGLTPLTAQFTDTSTGTPTSWSWAFGDGATSTDQNPVHTYTTPGTYTVTLTASGGIVGENPPLTSDTSTRTNLIAAYDPIIPSFSATPATGYIPLSVRFTDTSSGFPTTWLWDFGDGSTSTAPNPSHTYFAIGRYTVTLTVSHAADQQTVTQTNYIVADHQFIAAFTQDISYGMVPLTVKFTDQTLGTPAGYLWNFGDGATSTDKNPSHTYTSPGYYDVSLTVYGINTQNTVTHSSAVHVGVLPTVAFSGTPTSGAIPLSVAFTSTSQNAVSYLWNFGDGTTSSMQHPSHTYANPGTYTVTLTGTNIYGSTVSTRTNYITVTHVPPVAAFSGSPLFGHAPVPVKFTDRSTNTPTSWSWDFGDGTTSTERNPRHIYRDGGTYTVTLTVSNSGGSDTTTRTGYVTIYAPGDPGYTERYPESTLITTLDATGLSTQAATLNAELTAAAATGVWFEYGTRSNSYGYKTGSVMAEPGSLISTEIKNFPLIAGQTYHYRAVCTDGYGVEKTFTLPAVSPRATTTYGAAADQFLYSFEDGDTMIQDMAEATWSPYVTSLGALFFALVIGAVFMNLAMKGHSIAIPTLLVMIIGVSLWAVVPPEFVVVAQAFLIMGLGGLIYYIYTKRKL